jgi:hypothetical protein
MQGYSIAVVSGGDVRLGGVHPQLPTVGKAPADGFAVSNTTSASGEIVPSSNAKQFHGKKIAKSTGGNAPFP